MSNANLTVDWYCVERSFGWHVKYVQKNSTQRLRLGRPQLHRALECTYSNRKDEQRVCEDSLAVLQHSVALLAEKF